ncbi:hypothetical protein KFL_001240290 [Klebsormidium nitens]|uniref:ubiquitinyl hydrolase 1 n=1 Tax=Klebsormidium nitens TaxID=105231 RepID=A0A1Y1I3W9_KLENI|nr:hypothetical protein KFL_001240290 [Klebsormidium nitens]|eukprot:GAQ82798.1 hypothetical protein KFL_001240290 [Klebsormidium nitens]
MFVASFGMVDEPSRTLWLSCFALVKSKPKLSRVGIRTRPRPPFVAVDLGEGTGFWATQVRDANMETDAKSARPDSSRDARGREELGRTLKVLQERARQLGFIVVIRRCGIEDSGRERNRAERAEAKPVIRNELCQNGQPKRADGSGADGKRNGRWRRAVPESRAPGAVEGRAERDPRKHGQRTAKDRTPPDPNAEGYRGPLEDVRHPGYRPGEVPGNGLGLIEPEPQDTFEIAGGFHGRDPVTISLRPNLSSPGEGLENLVNTCYLSTVVQCLMYALQNLLWGGHHSRICRIPVAQFCLPCSLERLLKACFSGPGMNAREWRAVVDNKRRFVPEFGPDSQQDAHEALLKILQNLKETCLLTTSPCLGSAGRDNESEEQSVISATFGGTSQTQLRCLTCGKRTLNEPEPFVDLSLGVSGPSLESALEGHMVAETLCGEDKVFCDGEYCERKRPTMIQTLIREPPRMLIAHVKRFKENGAKDAAHVGFSQTLSAADYLVPASRASRPRYKLEGVVVHEGESPNAGHYIAYVLIGGSWYLFDDASVTRAEWAEVAAAQGYIFFYRRTHPDSSLQVYPSRGRARDARDGRARPAPRDDARLPSALSEARKTRACTETALADAREAQARAKEEGGRYAPEAESTEPSLGNEPPGQGAAFAKAGVLDATIETGAQKEDNNREHTSPSSGTASTAIEARPDKRKPPENAKDCHVVGCKSHTDCSADADKPHGQAVGSPGRTADLAREGTWLKAEMSCEVHREEVERAEEREKSFLVTGEETLKECPDDGSPGPREPRPVGGKRPPLETAMKDDFTEERPGDILESPPETDRCRRWAQGWRCPLPRAFGYSVCQKHLDMERRKQADKRARNEIARRERARAERSFAARAQGEGERGAGGSEVISSGRAEARKPEAEGAQVAEPAGQGSVPGGDPLDNVDSKASFESPSEKSVYPLRNRKRKARTDEKMQLAVGGTAGDPIVIASDEETPVAKRPRSPAFEGVSCSSPMVEASRAEAGSKEPSYSTSLWFPPPGESTEGPAGGFALPGSKESERPGRVGEARAARSGHSEYDWSDKEKSDVCGLPTCGLATCG